MRYTVFLFVTLHLIICKAQEAEIFFNNDSNSVSTKTSYNISMSWSNGYFAGNFKMFMIEGQDTCCIFSSIGETQFQSSTSELSSDISVYCWPWTDTRYDQPACEAQPRKKPKDAELVMKFHFEPDKKPECVVTFYPERCEIIDECNYNTNDILKRPHYYADNIYGILCRMLKQGKDKKEIESFLDSFDKHLKPSLLDPYGEYGYKYGHGYGYAFYKYNYYLFKALLHISGKTYVGKEITEMNNELNKFYQLYDSHCYETLNNQINNEK